MKQYLFLPALVLLLLVGCSTSNTQNKSKQELLTLFSIENYSQVVEDWISPSDPNYNTTLLAKDVQQKHFLEFYDRYYGSKSPWNADYTNIGLKKTTPNDLATLMRKRLIQFSNQNKEVNKIGYGENFRPYTDKWIDQIHANINITQFNNLVYKPANRAIAIDNLYARVLPTDDVYFYSHKIAGEGYPFDNLQMTAIWAGTPLYIVGTTKDFAWSLVLSPDVLAWVKSNGITRTNNKFVNQWQKAAKAHLVAITTTKTSILDMKGNFLFSAYIGSVFPMINDHVTTTRKLMVPVAENGYATVKYAKISTQNAVIMPMPATPHNMAKILSSLVGRPYGWGNAYFYNDCSAELKNLYTPFGIWLPRHSANQVEVGQMVDMSYAAPHERLGYLMKNGKPFFTIVYINGHVFMYIGNYHNPQNKNSLIAMTYQNKWGLKSTEEENTRIILGGGLFLPLLIQYPEMPYIKSLAAEQYFKVTYLDQ